MYQQFKRRHVPKAVSTLASPASAKRCRVASRGVRSRLPPADGVAVVISGGYKSKPEHRQSLTFKISRTIKEAAARLSRHT